MIAKVKKLKKFLGVTVWRYLLASILVGLLWFAVESSFIFMLQGFLSAIGLLKKSQSFLPDWYPTSLGASVAILITFGLMRTLVSMLKNYLANLTQVTFGSEQRLKLLKYGLKNAQVVSTKELIALFSEIVSQSSNVIYNISMVVNTAFAAFLFFFTGLKIAPIEMLVGVGLLSLFLFPMRKTTRKINGYGLGLIKEWENLNESLLRGLRNNFFLSIYNQVDAEINQGERSLKNYQNHYEKYSIVSSFAGAFPSFLGISILSLITYLSVRFIHTDPMKLLTFFYIFIRLAQAAGEASATLSNLKLNMPGLKRLYHWSQVYEPRSVNEKLPPVMIKGNEVRIEATNIAFKYESLSPLFSGLNFDVSKSDVLIIKGESGVGKSTLLSIILGINVPTVGEVKINSSSSSTNFLDLHKVLAYVGPEPYLIQGSVRDNMLYGLENKTSVSNDEIWSALEKLELKELIEKLPLALEAQINEIAQLSTGQKQRLSFARALLRKPALLILDEATANLDAQTEQKIISNLKVFINNCTTIIVTHKDSFDKIATSQIVLEKTQGG